MLQNLSVILCLYRNQFPNSVNNKQYPNFDIG
uniref:Uncharacterized protein n=1 Tax=Arundo donax TaxID=35708 RepID=A0A0A9AB60_ARUDO